MGQTPDRAGAPLKHQSTGSMNADRADRPPEPVAKHVNRTRAGLRNRGSVGQVVICGTVEKQPEVTVQIEYSVHHVSRICGETIIVLGVQHEKECEAHAFRCLDLRDVERRVKFHVDIAAHQDKPRLGLSDRASLVKAMKSIARIQESLKQLLERAMREMDPCKITEVFAHHNWYPAHVSWRVALTTAEIVVARRSPQAATRSAARP